MKNDTTKMSDNKKRIVEGLELAASRLLIEKRRLGQNLVTMIDGKVVELTVEEYEQMKAEGRI